jgi:hypothetical protein
MAAFDPLETLSSSRLSPAVAEPRQAFALADLRFRTLVGEAAWAELPEAVRRRFSKRLAPQEMMLYRGTVVATELPLAGRILAFLARAIGSPLPLTNGATGPALVAVIEDERLGGQSWTRIYARPGRFPQTIHSAKRFRGPTGLEEHVGCGIGMALKVSVEQETLVFRSVYYFVEIGRWRWRLPRALEPGRMEIEHREEGGGMFSFRLALRHPILGLIVHQLAHFCDTWLEDERAALESATREMRYASDGGPQRRSLPATSEP